jgi:hypothetical protein
MENATAIKIIQEAANIAIKQGCFGLIETSNIIYALQAIESLVQKTDNPAVKPPASEKK